MQGTRSTEAEPPGAERRIGALRPAAAAATALVRRHRLFAVTLLAAAVLRLLVTIAYRPVFLFADDSYWYLSDAVHHQLNWVRPYGYSAFLIPLLKLHSLVWVAAVQHVLGLASAVIVYALVRRLGAGAVWATVATVPMLFDPLVLDLEQYVMAETLFVFLTVSALALLAWCERPSSRTCLLVGLLLAAAVLTRTGGLILIAPAVLYLVVRRRPRQAVAMVAAFAVPLLAYATAFHHVNGQFALTAADGHFLYGRVAPFAECSTLSLPSYERALCPSPAMSAAHSSPNFYAWRKASPLSRYQPPAGRTADSVARDFALRVIAHQPMDYAASVWDGLTGLARMSRDYRPPGARNGAWQLPTAAERAVPSSHKSSAYRRYGGAAGTVGSLADAFDTYESVVYTPGPLLVLAIVIAAAGVLFGRPLRAERPRLRGECALLLLSALGLIVVPVMTVAFSYRYIEPPLAVLPAAAVLGVVGLLSRFEGARSPAAGALARNDPHNVTDYVT